MKINLKHDKGYVGCTLSHIECLKIAIERKYDNILIVEDDIVFKDPELFNNISEKIFDEFFDVFLLGVNIRKYEQYNSDFIRVIKGLTTTGYIVKKHYFTKLLENYEEGLKKLLNTNRIELYSVDTFTSLLQSNDKWLTFEKLNVSQLPSYSDIVKLNVDYDYWMLNKIKKEYYSESL
jgi:GR25 family glycosyltransferase involved in LPS biosynthesis